MVGVGRLEVTMEHSKIRYSQARLPEFHMRGAKHLCSMPQGAVVSLVLPPLLVMLPVMSERLINQVSYWPE